MFSWEYPPRIVGGISRVVYHLAQGLGKKGHTVHVITLGDEGTQQIEKHENVYVHRVDNYNINVNNFIGWVMHLNYAIIEYTIKLFKSIGEVDIIHAHDWMVVYAARVLKHAYKVPMVCTIHATEQGRNSGIYNDMQKYINDMEWWLTYEAWEVICNSEYMREEIKGIFSVPDNKLNVIPNGISADKFDDLEKVMEFRRRFAADNEKIIFFVGRIVQEKGIQILLDAVPSILKSFYDIKIILAGKGPHFDCLKQKSEEMGISHKVYFTGYIDDEDLKKLYKCADIAVFPSLYEPFGIVVLEAMAAGIPVVATDAGGLNDIIEHGIDGMKAYIGNSDSLAYCITELLHSPGLCDKLVLKAKDKIKNHYDWGVITDKTFSVYERVVKQSKETIWG
jgi:glycosyltransferase involved in cell wall biosynthesis